jgi:hypothetical protein
MTAHRYWRIYIESNDYGSYPCLAEVSMSATVGGANQIGSGTPSASSFAGGTTAAEACDGNGTTYWNASSSVTQQWWAYDFGSAVAVAEVVILPRADTPSTTPKVWELEYSDDNTNWVAIGFFQSATWVAGTTQTFEVNSLFNAAPLADSFWRIYFTSSVYGSYPALAEVSMAASVGGPNLIGSGVAFAQDIYDGSWPTFYPPSQASDGNTTTAWVGNLLPNWWAYGFGASVSIAEVTILPVTPPSGTPPQAPEAWSLQSSPDGTTWTTVTSFVSAPWVAGTSQTFTVTSIVPPLIETAVSVIT